MADEWYTQPMSDYGSPGDSFYGAGGQPVSSYSQQMPMDAGPAFQDWGSYGALAGLDQGGIGWVPQQQQQPDQTLNSLQMGLNQAGGQDQPSYSPQIQPSGGGSWFKQLLSTTIFGMAQGAGQQDPGTAFAAGYLGVEQQKERQRQLMIEQQKMEREQYMFQLDRAKKNVELLKLQQDYENAPAELQAKTSQAEAALYNSMAAAGKTPMMSFPATAEGLKQGSEQMKQMGIHPGEFFPLHVGNQIVLFGADPNDIAPQGTFMNIGGVQSDMSGKPWSFIKDLISDSSKQSLQAFEAHQNDLNRQNAMNIAKEQASATRYSADHRSNYATMNNIPEDVNIKINGIQKQIDANRSLANSFQQYGAQQNQSKIAGINEENKKLQSQIDALMAPYQKGVSVTMGQVGGDLPHADSLSEYKALPMGAQYIGPDGKVSTKTRP